MKKIMIGILLNLFFVACNSSKSTNGQVVISGLSKESIKVGLSNEELLSYLGVPREEIECPNGFKNSRVKDSSGVIICKGDRGIFTIGAGLSPYLDISNAVFFSYEIKNMKCSRENVFKMFPSFKAKAKVESDKPDLMLFSMDEPIAKSDLTHYRIVAGCGEAGFIQSISTTIIANIKIKDYFDDEIRDLNSWIYLTYLYLNCDMIHGGSTANEVALEFYPKMVRDLRNVISNHPQKSLLRDKILKNFLKNFTFEKTVEGLSDFQHKGPPESREEIKQFCKNLYK